MVLAQAEKYENRLKKQLEEYEIVSIKAFLRI
jgi:hypothetical protein